MQNQSDPSLFLTSTTALHHGDWEGRMAPFLYHPLVSDTVPLLAPWLMHQYGTQKVWYNPHMPILDIHCIFSLRNQKIPGISQSNGLDNFSFCHFLQMLIHAVVLLFLHTPL